MIEIIISIGLILLYVMVTWDGISPSKPFSKNNLIALFVFIAIGIIALFTFSIYMPAEYHPIARMFTEGALGKGIMAIIWISLAWAYLREIKVPSKMYTIIATYNLLICITAIFILIQPIISPEFASLSTLSMLKTFLTLSYYSSIIFLIGSAICYFYKTKKNTQ